MIKAVRKGKSLLPFRSATVLIVPMRTRLPATAKAALKVDREIHAVTMLAVVVNHHEFIAKQS